MTHPTHATPARVIAIAMIAALAALLAIRSLGHAGTVSVPHGFGEPDVCALTHGDEETDPLTGMVLQSALEVTVEPA